MTLRGLQAGFGDPLGADLLATLRDRIGVAGLRIDCQRLTAAETADRVNEVRAAGLRVLAIVRAPAQVYLLPPDVDVEVGNEPDLNGPDPLTYARWVTAIYEAAAPRQIRVWAGVVSNLNSRGFSYLANTIPQWPADVGVTVHRYPHGNGPTTPHPGFASREAEVQRLQLLAGRRPWGVSEFGYHTARRPIKIWGIRIGYQRWSDAEVATFARFEWAFWERMGAVFACWYQINDGPSDTALDRYGIRRTDGSWKPVAETFRETT